MPNLMYVLVAHDFSIDASSNNLTVFKIIERIGGPGPAFALARFVVLTCWTRTDGDEGVSFQQRTSIVGPDGQEIVHVDVSFQLTKPRHRVQHRIDMLPFKSEGCHRVEVRIRRDDEPDWGAPVATYPIDVDFIATEPEGLLPHATQDEDGQAGST